MEMLADFSLFQGAQLSLNTATVVLLYKMHRDGRDHTATARLHWHWIEKLRRAIWPEAFAAGDGPEPRHDAP